MSAARDNYSEIADTAALWLARHDRGLTPAEEQEFSAWLANPLCAKEWFSLAGTWEKLAEAAGAPDLTAEATLLELRTRRGARRAARRWVPATLAAAAAITFAAFFFIPRGRDSAEDTGPAITLLPAAFTRQTLPDGSVVELHQQTTITVDYSDDTRRVHLPAGEAFFTVAHDESRPFLVETGHAVVRAVGTAFNVRHDTAALTITVAEGGVLVATAKTLTNPEAPVLKRGSQATITRRPDSPAGENGQPEITTRPLAAEDLDAVLAWRSPLLEFRRVPLPDVLDAFARQQPHRVRLGDPALASRTVTGTFRADNISGFLRLAADTLAVRGVPTPDGSILLMEITPLIPEP